MPSQALPDIVDPSGTVPAVWQTPATEGDVRAAVAYMLTAVEPTVADERVGVLIRMLGARGYTRAELLLATQELPFDADASHNYNRGFNPADVERIIKKNRKARAMLARPVSSRERDDLITEHPGTVDPDGFRCCGFDSYNNPLWRYAPQVKASKPPTPELSDKYSAEYVKQKRGAGAGRDCYAHGLPVAQCGGDGPPQHVVHAH